MADVLELEWNTSNTTTAYPFTEYAVLQRTNQLFSAAVVDASITLQSAAEVSLISLNAPRAGATLVLHAGVDLTFEGATQTDYGEWRILSWADSRGTVTLVLLASAADALSYPARPMKAVFVPRVVEGSLKTVTGLLVDNQRLLGDVSIVMGYNMDSGAEAGVAGTRPYSDLSLFTATGAGEGTPPCECDEADLYITAINQVTPARSGGFTLDAVDCYAAVPVLQTSADGAAELVVPGRLNVSNHCSPCCGCADYEYLYGEVLTPLADELNLLIEDYTELKKIYEEHCAQIERAQECRKVPEVVMVVTPMYCRAAHIALGFKNHSDLSWPAAPTQVQVLVQPPADTVVEDAYIRGGSSPRAELAHLYADGVFEFTMMPAPCCSTTWVEFVVRWAGAGEQEYIVNALGSMGSVMYDLSATGTTRASVNMEVE